MLPWRKPDNNDLLYRIAEYITQSLNKKKVDEKVIKETKKEHDTRTKKGSPPLLIRLVIYVPMSIPHGRKAGFWKDQFNTLRNTLSNSIKAEGGTNYNREGFYKFDDGRVDIDHHFVHDVSVGVSDFIEDTNEFIEGLRKPLNQFQRDMIQDKLWVVINGHPMGESGFDFLQKWERKELGPLMGDFPVDEDQKPECKPNDDIQEPMPAVSITNFLNTGDGVVHVGHNKGTLNVTNHIYQQAGPSNPEKPIMQPGHDDKLRDAIQLIRKGKKEAPGALSLLEEGYHDLGNAGDTPRINESRKRYVQKIIEILKKNPMLKPEKATKEVYLEQEIHLTREVRIPYFDDINRVVNTYSTLRQFVDDEENATYFDHIGYIIQEVKKQSEELGKNPPSHIVKQQFKLLCKEQIKVIKKYKFEETHRRNIELTEKYFSLLKDNVTERWKQMFHGSKEKFAKQGYEDEEFYLDKFVRHDSFPKIDKEFEGAHSLKSVDKESITSWVYYKHAMGGTFDGETFECVKELENNEELWGSFVDYLQCIAHCSNESTGEGPDELDQNFVTALRFCSLTDTREFENPLKMLAVVLEKYGEEKPWEKMARYENIKSRIDALSWKEYIPSECQIKDYVDEEPKDTQETLTNWLNSPKTTLKIEGIGGLGKTAAVLQFIRKFAENEKDKLDYNFLYLTAKSKEQGEYETNAKARLLGYKTKVTSNFNLGIGEYVEGLPFNEFLKRLNSLVHKGKSVIEISRMNHDDLQEDALNYLERKKVIIFLDNFEDVTQDEREKYSRFFDDIYSHKNTKIIITTRPGRGKINTDQDITIQPLNASASSKLFLKRYEAEYNNSPKPNPVHLGTIRELSNELNNPTGDTTGIFERLKLMIKENPKNSNNISKLLGKIHDGSGHPLILFYMVSLCLQFDNISVCCNNNFFPTTYDPLCPSCNGKERAIKQSLGFFDLLYHLSINEKTGFAKATGDWEEWVTARSFDTLPADGRNILKILYKSTETLEENDLYYRVKQDEPSFTKSQFTSSLKSLKSQLIFLYVVEKGAQSLYALKERARKHIISKEIFKEHEISKVNELPGISSTRLQEILKLTEEVQKGDKPDTIEFDVFNAHLGNMGAAEDKGLLTEQHNGTNPHIIEALVDLSLAFQSQKIPQQKWFEHIHGELVKFAETDLSPGRKDWLNDQYFRFLLAASNDRNFFKILEDIGKYDLFTQSLNSKTHVLLVSFFANVPPEWLYRVSSRHNDEAVIAIFTILGQMLDQPEFENQAARARVIDFIVHLYQEKDSEFFDKINLKTLVKILKDFTRSVNWLEAYDDLYDRFVSKGRQKSQVEFLPMGEPNQLRRYDRINHDEFQPKVLRHDQMKYVGVFDNDEMTGSQLFGDLNEKKQFELSFDKWCEVEKKFVFRFSHWNWTLRSLRDTEQKFEAFENLTTMGQENNTSESAVEKIVHYLLDEQNLDSMGRIARKRMEDDLSFPFGEEILADALKLAYSQHQCSVEILEKGDKYLESYRITNLSKNKELEEEFKNWFQDKSEKEYYHCRGLPLDTTITATLIAKWMPRITSSGFDSKEWTTFARKVAEDRFAKEANGNPKPEEYSLIWKMSYYIARHNHQATDFSEIIDRLIKHQTGNQRNQFIYQEHALEQIQKWKEEVLSKVLEIPPPEKNKAEKIEEAYQDIRFVSIYNDVEKVKHALNTLALAGENVMFAKDLRSGSSGHKPMHQDTYEYLKIQTKQSFIPLADARKSCQRYKQS